MLAIDCGNSRLKAGLWQRGALVPLQPVDRPANPDDLPGVLADMLGSVDDVSRVVVASVVTPAHEAVLSAQLAARFDVAPEFAAVTPERFPTDYSRPDVLGVDRWLAALGAWVTAGDACAVVDCGTAVTVDLVSREGRHEGGLIAPGTQTMARALSTHTARLPLVAAEPPARPGRSTDECIALGSALAVEGLIRQAARRFDPDGVRRWFVTGGAGSALAAALSDTLTLEHRPHLVLEGLVRYAEQGEPSR